LRADVIADDGGQGPSLVQEDARPPSAPDPPVGIADGASKPLRPSSEDAGHYSLASAANSVADTPHSAHPVLAPADEAGAQAGKAAESDADARSVASLAFAGDEVDASLRAARLYFRIAPRGQRVGAREPWARGEAPRWDDAEIAARNSASVKLAAVPPVPFPAGERGSVFDAPVERADLPPLPADPGVVMKNGTSGGQTVAAKGQVTGEHQRPMTPTGLLGLGENTRSKTEKCLGK